MGILAKTELFESLQADVLRSFVDQCSELELKAGQTLFAAGDSYRDEIYILVSGDLEVVNAFSRKEDVYPGYLVGLSSYFTGMPYASTATAISVATVLALAGAKLKELEQQHAALFDGMNRIIAKCLRDRSISQAPLVGTLTQNVREIMRTPVISCRPRATLAIAFQLMQDHGIGSLAVLAKDSGLAGHICYADIAAGLLRAKKGRSVRARDICEPAATVEKQEPLWRAKEIIEHNNTKHVFVLSGNKPVGVLSQTDIMRALSSQQGFVRASISRSNHFGQLAEQFRRITDIANELLIHNRNASEAVASLSEVHLAIQNRCIQLTLDALEQSGLGEPPIPFAFIIMGSGGRKEMLLNPDQDNGIILANHDESISQQVKEWFREFAARTNDNLDRIGYPLCPGNIMAGNPMYHKTLHEWKAQIEHMVRHPNEKSARWSNIVFDFDIQFGDSGLTHKLRSHILRELEKRPKPLQFMVSDDAQGKPALDWFNRLISTGRDEHQGKIDLKRNGLRIITNASRILSLRYGVREVNTARRLVKLQQLQVISPDFCKTVAAAHEELLDLTLSHQIEQQKAGIPADKLVVRDELPSASKESVRVAMRAVKRFQDFLQDRVGALE